MTGRAANRGRTSEELITAYRSLSARYQPNLWVEPKDARGHLSRLAELLADDTTDRYPGRLDFDRSDTAAYLADWEGFLASLGDADLPDALRRRVQSEVADKLEQAAVLARDDDAGYAEFERTRVGLPDAELIRLAQSILDGDLSGLPFSLPPGTPDTAPVVTSPELRDRMSAALSAYDLADWTAIEEADMTAQASVNGPLRRIRVRAGTAFTPRDADRLLAHEVGGHVLRWANSQAQPEAWASIPLGRTVATEEGMAAWREVQFGLITERRLRIYATRVVAVDAAQREGVVGVARHLLPHVGLQSAAEIAIRVKRGLRDPNKPGGQTKDWGYLDGLLRVCRLAGESPDTVALMAGVKWPLEDARLVTELHQQGHLLMPTRLPDARKLGLLTIPVTAHPGSDAALDPGCPVQSGATGPGHPAPARATGSRPGQPADPTP